jgi:hypothetical protein
MDISRFSDVDFDVKDWVNGALRSNREANTPIDAHASMLVMKLQLFIQEVNNSLEETGQQVVQSLPRVVRDVEAVKQEALLLREQMMVVKDDIKKVEMDTSSSMQRLIDLDDIKKRMNNSKKALQEADNWVTLAADVEDIFATQDIDQISDQVIRMQQSLKVLHDVPDYEERRKLLETLKNRMESLISPKLIAAFNDHMTSEAKRYVEIFDNIGHGERVKEFYIQCHKNTIQQVWSSFQQTSETSSFQKNLTSFYNQLLSLWTTEFLWCRQVFSSPLSVLGKVFGESLSTLKPPLSQSLHTSVHRSQDPVICLMEMRNIMLNFLNTFFKSLDTKETADPFIYPLIEIFHLPYCQLLVQYGSLQQQSLMKILSGVNLIDANAESTLHNVTQSISTVITRVDMSIAHCLELTDGWGFTALIKCLDTFFVQFGKKLFMVLQDLRSSMGSKETDTGDTRNGSQAGDEWAELHLIFRFIQSCGDLLLRTSSISSQICRQLLSCSKSFRQPASPQNPFGIFDYLCIFHPEEHTAVFELVATIEKYGEEHMLLPATTNQIKLLAEAIHGLAFDRVFAQLKNKLVGIPKLKIWLKDNPVSPLESPKAIIDDLPSFSLSPLSYITEIGDQLLTLPQQLEPFTLTDNPSLMAAMRLGKLPYTNEGSNRNEGDLNLSDMWLDAISCGTMETYIESILLIPRLTDAAALQLATDIAYLCNVLAALDQQPTNDLSSLEKLLKSDKET